MLTLPPLLLAQVALTQDAARLFPAVRDAVDAADAEIGTWLARRAAALAPDESWPYVSLALLSSGAAALACDRRAQRLLPENPDTLRRIARHWINHGDPGRAETVRQRLLALDPADTDTIWRFALARFATADARAALDLARAVRLRPGLRDDAYTLGRSLALEGNVTAAASIFVALQGLGPPPAGMALEPKSSPAIADAIRAGGSLATVMSPDPFLPTNWPEYLEGYCFDHVVVSGNRFWALPQPITVDPGGPTATSFAYFSDSRLFLRYTTAPGMRAGSMADLVHYPGDAYKEFRFVVRQDHTLVYDSADPSRTTALGEAIRSGSPMRLVLEPGDGLVHVLPVHLCFLYKDSGRVRVLSELRYAPEFCVVPADALWPFYAFLMNSLDREHRFVLARRKDDGSDGIEHAVITLTDGLKPEDFPLGCIARKLDLVNARSRLLLRKLVVHSEGHYDSFGPDGEDITRPFAAFRVYARS